MTDQISTWTSVDQYFSSYLVASDPVMDQILKNNEQAGLPPHDVSLNQGKLLQLYTMLMGARRILEVGTLGGYSTIWMARGISHAEGKIISLEIDPERAAVAKKNIELAGFRNVIEIKIGPASEAYSLWELKALLAYFHPDLVLVEIRPEAASENQWGEGPIEMPFIALSAKEMGIAVDGMDDWSKEFNAREDKMAANISTKATKAQNVLVFTGYSHISGLTARLNDAGFKSDPPVRQKIENAFSTRVDRSYPRDLASEYDKIIRLVESGKTQYNVDWASKRKTFVKTILSSGH